MIPQHPRKIASGERTRRKITPSCQSLARNSISSFFFQTAKLWAISARSALAALSAPPIAGSQLSASRYRASTSQTFSKMERLPPSAAPPPLQSLWPKPNAESHLRLREREEHSTGWRVSGRSAQSAPVWQPVPLVISASCLASLNINPPSARSRSSAAKGATAAPPPPHPPFFPPCRLVMHHCLLYSHVLHFKLFYFEILFFFATSAVYGVLAFQSIIGMLLSSPYKRFGTLKTPFFC